MVADYGFYRDVYLGEVLSSEDFPGYATRADAYLEELTYGKYANPRLPEGVITNIKMAECSIADLCFSMAGDAAAGSSVTKETVGSHSVTYSSCADAAAYWKTRIFEAAQRYLFPTGLLYRGAKLKFEV